MEKDYCALRRIFKKGALNILEFLYVCKKIIDILVALATVFEEKTAKLLVKITKKEIK
ncbi:hypothetical protein HNO90_001223 [Staphylococcus hominis]|uniref:hypothetical protein n=1 Tax=Staphylococcus hominis TaxID=1290 RepID=UPI001619D16D|nr:hypothetical protein [Staphylococcus hominis]MBB4832839.1 hypothetical protein [Staphylococcus hominis]